MIKLYGYWRSSATWRVRIALLHKNVPFEVVPVHLMRGGGEQHTASFRALNPMQHVPVLRFEHGGETNHVSESLAIVELLEELYPTPALLPKEPFARARARQLALLVCSGIQPLINTKVQLWVRDELKRDEASWARHWLTSGLAALEASLSEHAGTFAVGEEPSIADVCIVPQLYMARRLGVLLDAFPRVLGIERACLALPAFEQAQPQHQPDFEPG